jgi:hypothetical protein
MVAEPATERALWLTKSDAGMAYASLRNEIAFTCLRRRELSMPAGSRGPAPIGLFVSSMVRRPLTKRDTNSRCSRSSGLILKFEFMPGRSASQQ